MELTAKIITKRQFNSMVDQLVELGAIKSVEHDHYQDALTVKLSTPKGKEIYRAIIELDGDIHARWVEGLFDAN